MDGKQFFLRDIWYFALSGHQLKPGRMVAKTLLGEPIVFARDRNGTVFALQDICPHRAIPLSCGRFDGSEVECCYHGWRFNGEGQCTAIPSLVEGQTLDFSRFRVRSYPVREVQGNIWIFMPADRKSPSVAWEALRDRVPEIPQVPGVGDRPADMVETIPFPCYLDHAVVGLMDPAHGPFVHRVWWWRSKGALFEKSKAFEPLPYGFSMRRHRLLKTSLGYRLLGKHPEVQIDFHLPGVRIEQVVTDRHILCNLTTVTPLTEKETEVNTMFYTTVPWFRPLVPIVRQFTRAFFNQDRDVVVKQQIGLQHHPTLMLIDDADRQARWYGQLKAAYARAIEEGVPFVNPIESRVLRWRS